jgi:hypothetical protein
MKQSAVFTQSELIELAKKYLHECDIDTSNAKVKYSYSCSNCGCGGDLDTLELIFEYEELIV